MKRDIYSKLLKWKTSKRRKPLLLKGSRQVGKTYILQEFGAREYDKIAYFNFEEISSLDDFFQRDLIPDKILSNLSIQVGFEIRPEHHLVIFDEIQNSNAALNSLKYFNEKANEYHIAAAGSLLGVMLSKPRTFPIGKVNFLNLYPMTFLEFLDAVDESGLRDLIENKTSDFSPYPMPFHERLIELLRVYFFIGGMPEAVKEYAESGNFSEVRTIHSEIINSYLLDFAKHTTPTEIPKINLIWDSIPAQLAKENKKFIFSAVRKSARAREYEIAIQWLENAGLITKSYQVNTAKYPLKGYMNRNIFKVFMLDIGILAAMTKLPKNILIEGDRLFTEFKGAFVENYVAQQLQSEKEVDLFYWTSNGRAEVDFIIEYNERIFPLEVKAGISPKSKSLSVYAKQFKSQTLTRCTLLNLRQDGNIFNFPLYAINLFPDLLTTSDR